MQQETNLPHHLLWHVDGGLIHDLIQVRRLTLLRVVVFIRLSSTAHLSVPPHPLHLSPHIPLDAPTNATQQDLGSRPVGLGLMGLEAWETALEERLLTAQGSGEQRLRCLMACKVLQLWFIFTLQGCQSHVFVLFLTFCFKRELVYSYATDLHSYHEISYQFK